MQNEIFKKINNNKLNIAIIGLGYVGLPLSLLLSKKKSSSWNRY